MVDRNRFENHKKINRFPTDQKIYEKTDLFEDRIFARQHTEHSLSLKTQSEISKSNTKKEKK